MASPCQLIASQMGELYQCSEHDRYVRIRTPFLYPDGDIIDIYLRIENGTPVLTDLGETMRWLHMQTSSPKRSPKQSQILADVCAQQGIEFFRGMLVSRLRDQRQLAEGVTRIAQTALRASDIWFTMRTRAVQSTVDEVAEFLLEREIRFERQERLIGRSGRFWTIDFHTFTAARSCLVAVLSTGSRATAKAISERLVAQWVDLSHLRAGNGPLSYVTLFDDTLDVWSPEDLNLIEPFSTISHWSRPDEFERVLRAA